MFFALIYYLGTLSIEGSVVNITSIELISDGNLTLSNSTIFFQNSSIISNGCINIKNSNITIDVSNKKVGEEYLILKSTIGCLNYSSSLSVNYTNNEKCIKYDLKNNSNSLIMILSEDKNCNEAKDDDKDWIIIMIVVISCVVVLVAVVLTIIVSVPCVRSKIFAHERKRKEKKKIGELKNKAI